MHHSFIHSFIHSYLDNFYISIYISIYLSIYLSTLYVCMYILYIHTHTHTQQVQVYYQVKIQFYISKSSYSGLLNPTVLPQNKSDNVTSCHSHFMMQIFPHKFSVHEFCVEPYKHIHRIT